MRILLTILGCCLYMAGCSSSSTSPSPLTVVVPNVGSSFLYDAYGIDSSNAMSTGTRDTTIETVTKTDLIYGGKTHVLELLGTREMGSYTATVDTTFLSLESNSIAHYSVLQIQIDWQSLPLVVGNTSTQIHYDTTLFTNGVMYWKMTRRRLSVATETLVVRGTTIPVNKISEEYTVESSGVISSIQTAYTTLYFAPSLGCIAKVVSQPVQDPISHKWSDGHYRCLIDYSLK